jgi:lysozyme family protein
MVVRIKFDDALASEYNQLFALAEINLQHRKTVEFQVNRLFAPKSMERYSQVAEATGVPAHVVAIIHSLEANCDFDCHLHNGDPLTARTVQVPANRPKEGKPPFDWVVSAIDALRLEELDQWSDWSVAGLAFALERYNGFGYRRLHPNVKSPYLWSFTNIYRSGKFIGDGQWSDTAVSQQCGGMALLKHMLQRGLVSLGLDGPSGGGGGTGESPPPDRPFRSGSSIAMADADLPPPRYPGRYLRQGLAGPDVKQVQRRLLEFGIREVGGLDGDFGEKTDFAVRLFQARGTDADGDPLEIDGVVGPQTWRALFGGPLELKPAEAPRPGSLLEAVLDIATGEIGVREQPLGSNRGPKVDQYLSRIDPDLLGQPWCMAFVYWCFDQAAQRVGTQNPAPRIASVLRSWEICAERNLGTRISAADVARDPSLVRPGAVFYIATGGRSGHTGLVQDVIDGKLVTIEGNTNDGGSREGIGVFRRSARRVSSVNLGYVLF